MPYGKISTLFITVLLLVAISGCTQAQSASGEKTDATKPALKESEANPENNNIVPIDAATGNNNKELGTFEIEACNAADEPGTCNTNLRNLGIVSKEDCCQVLSKCCQT